MSALKYELKENVSSTFQGSYWDTYTAVSETGTQVIVRRKSVHNLELCSEDIERFNRWIKYEERLLQKIDHPSCIKLIETYHEGDEYFQVFEWFEGVNLFNLVNPNSEPMSEADTLRIACQLCDALLYLHDLSPSIIYQYIRPLTLVVIKNGGMKLVNFGLARELGNPVDVVDDIYVVSEGYSPPEAYYGEIDTRADLYSLGATMHYLLTGQEPVALATCSPKTINGRVSSAMDMVVQTATKQDKWIRYADTLLMKEALEELSKPTKKQWWQKFF